MSIITAIAESLAQVPSPVATTILAMLPVGELRGALPVALLVYRLPLVSAVFFSVLGNMIPVYFLLIFFQRTSQWIRERSPWWDHFFTALFERTRIKLHDKVEKYGVWALTLFVAVPLPVTGAWTGSLAAFVFGLPRRQAFYAILAGVCISAVIVTALTLGASFTVRSLLLLGT